MSAAPAGLWPWLAIAGLGVFHGANPAMGWLFAVALGLHRHSRGVVLWSLIPLALGHAASVATVTAGVLALGLVVPDAIFTRIAGMVLLLWAIWHGLRGHRQRLRVGMQTGLAGLALWSFVMASAHGAGLMLIPVILPLCLAAAPGQDINATGSMPVALAALGVHSVAMLGTIAAIAITVYEWLGLGLLRSAWINVDLIWIWALALCGAGLILA
jgi:hypothetical protein